MSGGLVLAQAAVGGGVHNRGCRRRPHPCRRPRDRPLELLDITEDTATLPDLRGEHRREKSRMLLSTVGGSWRPHRGGGPWPRLPTRRQQDRGLGDVRVARPRGRVASLPSGLLAAPGPLVVAVPVVGGAGESMCPDVSGRLYCRFRGFCGRLVLVKPARSATTVKGPYATGGAPAATR